ncbi:MAG: ferredoxin-type protein NapF [Epsilonproteobacteria bacterium]|nr:ferredoxin-type protein NapF [Campylobacterota bacterium]
MKRREFFSSFLPKKSVSLHPPYYKDPSLFTLCKDCDECARVCEEGIIVFKEDGTPILDFSKGGCTFCDECAKACPKGVLKVEDKRKLPPLTIDPLSCLAWNKTICSLCKEMCEERAIKFEMLFSPTIEENCTGCGFCVAVCPTKAIRWEG